MVGPADAPADPVSGDEQDASGNGDQAKPDGHQEPDVRRVCTLPLIHDVHGIGADRGPDSLARRSREVRATPGVCRSGRLAAGNLAAPSQRTSITAPVRADGRQDRAPMRAPIVSGESASVYRSAPHPALPTTITVWLSSQARSRQSGRLAR